MKVLNETNKKITIEFDLFDFGSLQEFFHEQKEAVENTGKFEYDPIQKFLAIKLQDPTILNDIWLRKINKMMERNQTLINGGGVEKSSQRTITLLNFKDRVKSYTMNPNRPSDLIAAKSVNIARRH